MIVRDMEDCIIMVNLLQGEMAKVSTLWGNSRGVTSVQSGENIERQESMASTWEEDMELVASS